MSSKFSNDIFITFEMPWSSYTRPVGKVNISLLFRPSVIRGPWLIQIATEFLKTSLELLLFYSIKFLPFWNRLSKRRCCHRQTRRFTWNYVRLTSKTLMGLCQRNIGLTAINTYLLIFILLHNISNTRNYRFFLPLEFLKLRCWWFLLHSTNSYNYWC